MLRAGPEAGLTAIDHTGTVPDQQRSTDRPVALLAVGWMVVAAGGLAGSLTAATSLAGSPGLMVALTEVVAGWSFAALGLVLAHRRTSQPLAIGSIAVAAAIFIPAIRWIPLASTWTLGWVLLGSHLPIVAWLFLAFPSGRSRPWHNATALSLFAYSIGLGVAGHLFQDPQPGCQNCPRNLLLVTVDDGLASRIWQVGQVINLAAVVAVLIVAIGRQRRASVARRRALAPAWWALGPIALVTATSFVEPLLGLGPAVGQAVLVAERLTMAVFPVALVVGLARSRLDRARVADLAQAVSNGVSLVGLEPLAATALGDPEARLGFASGSRASQPLGDRAGLIGIDGSNLEVGPGQVARPIDRETVGVSPETPVGLLIHDPALDEALVDAVAATLSLAVANESLRVELRRQLWHVSQSRQRLAEAGLQERRRIERDLHDGAQQGLLALAASLGSIRTSATGDVAERLDQTLDDLRLVIADLRDLARGVHPPILTERGLLPAIEALAERAPIPVDFDGAIGRCRPANEAAAYFLVAESLTNAIRHANASQVTVRLRHEGDQLTVDVADDGVGGADPGSGTGLQGLIDRFEAVGGQVIVSTGQAGTSVKGRLVCG